MTEAEREELIEKMAKAAWEDDGIRNQPIPEAKATYLRQARAALAIAEPVIREWGAEIARNKVLTSEDCCDATGEKIATAIREGGKDGI